MDATTVLIGAVLLLLATVAAIYAADRREARKIAASAPVVSPSVALALLQAQQTELDSLRADRDRWRAYSYAMVRWADQTLALIGAVAANTAILPTVQDRRPPWPDDPPGAGPKGGP